MSDSRLITLDKIWQHGGPLLRSINRQGNNRKDLCLAFALSRLLRCKLDGARLHAVSVTMTKKLICSQILARDDADKALGILAMELAFLNDSLHSSYPMVFSEGLLCYYITMLLNTLRNVMASWIGTIIVRAYGSVYGQLVEKEHATKLDLVITGITFFLFIFMQSLQRLTYSQSDWWDLVWACQYVRVANTTRRFPIAAIPPRFKISKQLVGSIGQYVFLQSFNYSAWKWRLVDTITMGVIDSKGDGTKLSDSIKLPQNVKVKVFEALSSLCSRDLNEHFLPRDLTSPWATRDQLTGRYWLACLQLPTCSHVILVLHIATCLCEMKLAKDYGMELTNPGCLRSSLSFLTKWSRSSQGYLLDEKSLDGDLRTNYEVANSLSRYCAYLLVSKPDLLPDTALVPKVFLQETVCHAREMLEGCDSLESIYNKLMPVPLDEHTEQGSHDRELSFNVMEEGARLGEKLIGEERRWEILAEVWVKLLVHMAPSSNAEAHAKYLESGSEFISLIWALLCHCGIEKSELWQEGAASMDNFLELYQQNNGVAGTQVQQTVASGPPATPPDGHASDVFHDLESGKDIGEMMEA